MTEHAVIVRFTYGLNDLNPLFALEDELIKAIETNGAGEFDGNELASDNSHGVIYMYGANADILFHVIKPVLQTAPFMKGATARLRYGPPEDDVKEIDVNIE
jgi:hypothetical protein